MKELRTIQQKLKVKKGQRNKFGNYNYRSTSDILEALKPLLEANKCTILMSDKILQVGTRNYIEATVKLANDKGESVESISLACEPEIQKGMASSQITGTASSYARKYALSGLFAIDDTDVVDSQDNTKPAELPELVEGSETYKKVLEGMAKGFTIDQVKTKYSLSFEVEKKLESL